MSRESGHENPMQRRQLLGALGAAAFAGLAPPAAAAPRSELFRIERSKNKNVVVYRAHEAHHGLRLAAPVSAYWLMLAEDGRREELTWAERRLAYGFEVQDISAERCRLTLSACGERTLWVERGKGGFHALCRIGGQRAVLQRIFVQTREGALLPSVQHVDLFGTSPSGAPLSERLQHR